MYVHKYNSINTNSLEWFPFKRSGLMGACLTANEEVLLSLENEDLFNMEYTNLYAVDIVYSELSIVEGNQEQNIIDNNFDILGRYGNECIAIIKLKNEKLKKTHLDELKAYLADRKQILINKPNLWQAEDKEIAKEPKWLGVLVGTDIDPDLAKTIEECCNDENCEAQIQIAALVIKRYKEKDNKENVYIITETFFRKSASKDYTQYIFNGKTLGKGRLVLEVIKNYVENNLKITYSELKIKFPNILQGTETFTMLKDASAKAKKSRVRHFLKPNEIIKLSDEKIAVSSQWGISNIDKFIEHCKNINIKIGIKK